MLNLTTVGLFTLASIILALTPGPDMLYIATRSVTQGRGAGIVSALGVHAGVMIHIVAAALGLSAIIAASATALNLVRYAGALYLIYLGMKTCFNRADSFELNVVQRSKLREIFYQGLITNVLNPKVILFFLAFLPQFVDPMQGHITAQLVILGLIFFIVTLPVDMAVGLAGGAIGAWLRDRKAIQGAGKWISGTVFIALGIGAALAGSRGT